MTGLYSGKNPRSGAPVRSASFDFGHSATTLRPLGKRLLRRFGRVWRERRSRKKFTRADSPESEDEAKQLRVTTLETARLFLIFGSEPSRKFVRPTKKDGRQLRVSIRVSPIRDSSGHVIGASKVARDITERKRAEERERKLLAGRSMSRDRCLQASWP